MNRQLIREQISVPEALEMLGLEAPDRQDKIHCPFHEEATPSCHVYQDHWHCFGCGAAGDVVWFVAQITGQSLWKAGQFLEGAVDDLSTTARVSPKERPTVDLTALLEDLTAPSGFTNAYDIARGTVSRRWPSLTLDYMRQFGVRVGRGGDLLIPHYDPMDTTKVVGIKQRLLNGEKTSVKGSRFNAGPYLGWHVGPRAGAVVLCEGEPDTLALGRATYPQPVNVVGLPSGAGAFPEAVETFLSRWGMVHLALDNDDAGREATLKISQALSDQCTSCLDLAPLYGSYKDVAEALGNGWLVPTIGPDIGLLV